MADERWAKVRRAMEPEWNDLREQRILARVQEARREAKPAPRARWAIAVAAVTVIGASALGAKLLLSKDAPAPVATATPSAPPKMVLADGSEAVLSADASVTIEEQRDEQVTIAQTAGEVRYDVKPNPKRRFAVRAGDVTVRVLGTAFTVGLSGEKVKVRVQRGKVEVDDGAQITVLVAEESLEVAAWRSKALEPAPPPPKPATDKPIDKKPAAPTVESLLAKADEARAGHRYDEAAEALRSLVALHPGDPRVASALFTLGRVERARGRHAAAAQAFARCHQVAPHGALAEDARAEEALSWKSAGDADKARTAAKKYVQLHPGGAHVARMMPLIE